MQNTLKTRSLASASYPADSITHSPVSYAPSGKGEIMEILKYPHPSLREKAEPYSFGDLTSEELEQVYWNLVDTMRASKGIGLAANQVGYKYRMFVMETGSEFPELLINPRIVNQTGEKLMQEGCLSFPNLFVKVKRSSVIRVRFQQTNGETETKDYVGLSARVVLHEYDHLEGIVMKDVANRIHWDQAAKKARK